MKGRQKSGPTPEVLQGDISDHIAALKAEDDKKDIFVFGSANLTAALLEKGAVDEIRVCLVPTVLGNGSPLFKDSPTRKNFNLIEARPFKSGGVLLRYARNEA